MEQGKKELLEIILGLKIDHKRKGTLQLALESARFYCGYKGDNYSSVDFISRQGIIDKIIAECGYSQNAEEGDLFSSLYLYLNCLEQIGNLFCENNQIKGIRRAIDFLPPNTLSHEEIVAVRVLRNALAHQLGLMGSTYDNNKKKHFKFVLTFSEPTDDKSLKLPSIPWDGDCKDKKEETNTLVFVYPFIRMAETIIANAKKAYQDQKLSCLLSIEEIETRYTILIDDSNEKK